MNYYRIFLKDGSYYENVQKIIYDKNIEWIGYLVKECMGIIFELKISILSIGKIEWQNNFIENDV